MADLTLTPTERDTWIAAVQARAEAVRALELASLQAQALVSAKKAAAMVAEDAVLAVLRAHGLDPATSWRLEGLQVVAASSEPG